MLLQPKLDSQSNRSHCIDCCRLLSSSRLKRVPSFKALKKVSAWG